MAQNAITTKGVLIVNGKQVTATFSELHNKTKKLQVELKKLKPGTQEFLDKATELRGVKAQFDVVRKEIFATNQEIKKSESLFSRFFNGFTRGFLVFELKKDALTLITQDLLKITNESIFARTLVNFSSIFINNFALLQNEVE